MKKKFLRTQCVILALSLTFMSSVPSYASQQTDEHIHGEECIYSCVEDNIDISDFSEKNIAYEHIDHEGSEDCRYGCVHDFNTYTSSESSVWTKEEEQSFLTEFQNATSDEEINEIISKYYDIPLEDVDFTEMKAQSEAFAKTMDQDVTFDEFIYENYGATDADVFLYENFGITSEENDNTSAKIAATDSCYSGNHTYLEGKCVQNHYRPSSNSCMVWCTRSAVCKYCKVASVTIEVRETVHTWSVGWCGQTCTVCGLIEMLHEEGGCYYCS